MLYFKVELQGYFIFFMRILQRARHGREIILSWAIHLQPTKMYQQMTHSPKLYFHKISDDIGKLDHYTVPDGCNIFLLKLN